ncbi:uncharacterized protein V3H82_019724 [Fundulus diaphanus]
MKTLLICTAILGMIITSESLSCRSCGVGFKGRCLYTSTETCDNSLFQCYKGNLVFNITELMDFHTRGCLPATNCNKTETGSLLTAGYTVTRDCCKTDYCNGAPFVQLTLSAALGAAVTAVWSQLTF